MPHDHDLEGLTGFAAQVLAQAQAVAEGFAARAADQYPALVGPHLRHVIEHFRALLTPAQPGVIAYDARARDPQLNRCPQTARRALGELRAALHRRDVTAATPVLVVGVAGVHGEGEFSVPSTYGRELIYSAMHAVHHFALIKPHCVAAGVELAPDFGVAPATVQHERSLARARADSVSKEPSVFRDLVQRVSRRAMLVFGAASLFVSAAARAASPVNTLKGGLLAGRGDTAIRGYDPVAYFTVGKAVPGQDAYAFDWMGATWKFASQAHLDLFKADPTKYAPQYGGYCAFGVAQGYLVGIQPDQFRIIDGKLFLNYDARVQEQWLKDPAGYIRQADARFPALLAK